MRVTNNKLLPEAFVNAIKQHISNNNEDFCDIVINANNLYARGNKIYSYRTAIALFDKNRLIYTTVKYSKTTSKHQSYIRNTFERYKEEFEIVAFGDEI